MLQLPPQSSAFTTDPIPASALAIKPSRPTLHQPASPQLTTLSTVLHSGVRPFESQSHRLCSDTVALPPSTRFKASFHPSSVNRLHIDCRSFARLESCASSSSTLRNKPIQRHQCCLACPLADNRTVDKIRLIREDTRSRICPFLLNCSKLNSSTLQPTRRRSPWTQPLAASPQVLRAIRAEALPNSSKRTRPTLPSAVTARRRTAVCRSTRRPMLGLSTGPFHKHSRRILTRRSTPGCYLKHRSGHQVRTIRRPLLAHTQR